MGKVSAAVMASTLALSTFSHAAEVVTGDHWHLGEGSSQRSVQSHMFDGITSTSTDARFNAAGKTRTASC